MRLVDDDVAVGANGIGVSLAWPRAQQLARFVEQRHVGIGPHDVVRALHARAVEQLDLLFAELLARCRTNQRFGPEQIVEQLRRRQHGPHALECPAHVEIVTHAIAQRVDADLVAGARGQCVEEFGFDELARAVVRAESGARVAHDALALLDREPQRLHPVADAQVFEQRSFTIANGAFEERHHAQVAFDAADVFGSATVDAYVGHEVGEHRLLDAGLAERRQHLLDVREEESIGPDHQDALAFEREPVGVEQVRGAVQRDHGLARARAALHDQHAGHRRPDDVVLFGLDRGDDVGRAGRCGPSRARR